MTTVAEAWLQIVPSTRGLGSSLEREMGPHLDRAGVSGGERLGSSMTSGFLPALGRMTAVAATAVGAALGAAGVIGVKTAAQMEKADIAFTTMLGSGERAQAFLKDLADFAAKTPFEFPELQTAASSLISIGIDSSKVIPIMRTLGDVTSGMGTGSEGVRRATVALQQMNAAGRITGEDLNQLRDAGVPVFDLLAAATGKSKEAVAELAQKGKLGRQELEQLMSALESGKGMERYAGLMDKQSQSLDGLWSTFKDTLNMNLAQAVQPLLPGIKAALSGLSSFLAEWMPKLAGWLQTAGEKAGELWQGLQPLVGGARELGAGFSTSVLPALQQFWTYLQANVIPKVRELAAAIGGWVSTVAPIVQQFVSGMLQRLAPLMPTITAIFQSIGSIIAGVMEATSTVIGQVTAGIKLIWDDWGEGIMNVVSVVWTAVGGIIQGALQFIQGIVQTVTSLIKGNWSGAWEGVKNIFLGAWNAMVSSIGGILQGLYEVVKGVPGKIVEGLGNLKDLLVDAGKDLIRGLINGIQNMASAVADKAREVVSGAINAAKSALGISSPSKVFFNIGENTGKGFELGMESRSRSVDAALARMVAVPAPAAPAVPAPTVIYVENPWTGEYLLGKVFDVAGGPARVATLGRRAFA